MNKNRGIFFFGYWINGGCWFLSPRLLYEQSFYYLYKENEKKRKRLHSNIHQKAES